MSSHREASRRSEAKTGFWPTSACIRRSLDEGGRESHELYRRKTNGEIAEAEGREHGHDTLRPAIRRRRAWR